MAGYGIDAENNLTIGTTTGTISIDATAGDTYTVACGLFAGNSLTVADLGGSISTTSANGNCFGLEGGTVHIDNAYGTITSTGDHSNMWGIWANSSLSIGTSTEYISVDANYGNAYGLFVYDHSGSITVTGNLGGTIAATSVYSAAYGLNGNQININDMNGLITASGTTACGIFVFNGSTAPTGMLTIGTSTATISAAASTAAAYGIYNVGTTTINQLGGAVTATAALGDACGIYSGELSINNISGAVSATATSGTAVAVAGNSVSITNISGLVTARGMTADALFCNGNINNLSGIVSATATAGTAVAVSAGSVNIANLSGKIIANGSAAAYGIYATDGINLTLHNGATLSATSTGGPAYAIYDAGSTADVITLYAGCNIVGAIQLSSNNNNILNLAGTDGNKTLAPNINGVGTINVTGGYWQLAGNVDGTNLNFLGGIGEFDGVSTGPATVGPGGFLSGIGTLGALTNDGVVAPGGSSIGTLHVAHNFTNDAGGSLDIRINSSGSSDKIVANTATLNGGMVHVFAAGSNYYIGEKFVFLTANGGVSGQFTGVTDNLAFLDAVLKYDATDAYIVLKAGGPGGGSYDDVGNTPNEHAVGTYLDSQSGGAMGVINPDFATVLANLNTLNVPDARAALNALSGEIHGSLATVDIETDEQFMRTISQHLQSQVMMRGPCDDDDPNRSEGYPGYDNRDLLCDSGWTTWAQGMGEDATFGSDGNASGLHYKSCGLAVGLERRFSDRTQIGVVGGYSDTYATLDDRNDNGSIDGGQLAVYLNHDFETFYFTGIAAGGYNSYTTTRSIDFAAIDRIAHVNTAGKDYSFYAEIGRTMSAQMFHFQPYLAMEYIEAYQDAFTEQGADSIDITSGGESAAACRGLLGARVAGTFQTGSGQQWTLEARAAWRHEFLDDARVLDATFATVSSTSFAVSGLTVDRDVAILGLGVNYRLTKTFTVFGNFDVLAGQNDTANAVSAALQYAW